MILEANVLLTFAGLRATNHFTDTLNTDDNFCIFISYTIENIFKKLTDAQKV